MNFIAAAHLCIAAIITTPQGPQQLHMCAWYYDDTPQATHQACVDRVPILLNRAGKVFPRAFIKSYKCDLKRV